MTPENNVIVEIDLSMETTSPTTILRRQYTYSVNANISPILEYSRKYGMLMHSDVLVSS